MLVFMCACRLRLCVRSGLRLRLTHHLSRPPPHHHALPVEDAAGALVISRAGAGCSGERRPTLGGRLAGLALLALLGPDCGVGGLWVSGPGPGPPWCGRLPVEPAGLPPRHPGAPTLWLSEVPLRALLCPFWVEAAVVPAVVLLGVPCPGGPPDVWGPGLFRACFMPCGMGLLFPTHTINITWRNLMNTSALTHTGVHSSIHIGCKNRCSQTPIVLICCCFKTYFVILVMCAAQ